MVGDSLRCDRNAPKEIGVMGYYLSRSGNGDFVNLLDFARAVACKWLRKASIVSGYEHKSSLTFAATMRLKSANFC